MYWLVSSICKLPRWIDVYLKWAQLSTCVTVMLNFVRPPNILPLDTPHYLHISFPQACGICHVVITDRDKRHTLRIVSELSTIIMLVFVCSHFIICVPTAVAHARKNLNFKPDSTQSKKGFNPDLKLVGVRQATFLLCASIMLRAILILLSVIGLFQSGPPIDDLICYELYYCGTCNPNMTLLSRIIENEYD
jgi:hypothetical protein